MSGRFASATRSPPPFAAAHGQAASPIASSHVECFHPCFIKEANLELVKIAIAIRSGHREYESGRGIGGKGDMRRAGFNVAKRHVIRIPGPELFRRVHLFFKVLSASVKIYGASASLIIHVFKAVFAHAEQLAFIERDCFQTRILSYVAAA